MSESTDNTPSTGLGDSIAKLTKALGLDKVVTAASEAAGKSDCGCAKRQAKLNQMFPYNPPTEPNVE